ncbi:MAG TPA: hypothetical protein ENK75_03785 [Saprospiraceae bacterium]|nr:hypothetical protein [Saprospiraceae bacterium]
MKRKDFNRLAILGAAGSVLSCKSTQGTVKDGTVVRKDIKKIKPRKLKEGDTIGLIAPGSAFTQEAYERTIDNIKTMGFRYKNAKNLFLKYGYLAGDDNQGLRTFIRCLRILKLMQFGASGVVMVLPGFFMILTMN